MTDQEPDQELHPGWFAYSLICGALLMTLAFFVPVGWGKQAVVENVLVGVGSAIALVGVLHFFT